MGASKTLHYSEEELNIALIARALAHPARVRIISILKKENFCRSVDLLNELNLVQSTVNQHINKLKDAQLIHLDFIPNCYLLKLNHSLPKSIVNLFDTDS